MAFLTLSDWTVAISKGGSRAPLIIGDNGRAFDGTLLRDRRVIKDRWQYETKGLTAEDADALVGLLLGLGDRWPFNDSVASSDKGLGAGATVGSFRWGRSEDGSPNPIESTFGGIYESKFGAGAISVDPATTNLLTASQRQASATTGFTAVGGAIATDTAYFLPTGEGTPTSVKHTRAALDQGVDTNVTVISTSTQYAASIYVMTLASGVEVTVDLIDDVDTIDGANELLTAGVWRRFELAGTSDVGAATAQITVRVTDGAAAGDIYIDGLQLEQQAVSTTWSDGARAAPDLTYSANFMSGAKGGTISGWVRMPTGTAGADRYLADLVSGVAGNASRLFAYRPSGGSGLTVVATDPDSSTTTIAYTTTIWDNDWHHIAVTFGKDARTGLTFLDLYVDGTNVSAQSSISYPLFGALGSLYPGSLSGGTTPLGAQSILDELIVTPYAMAADQVAALSAATVESATMPGILAKGDSIETPAGVIVEGAVPGRGYNGLNLGGNWHSTAQRVQFELDQQ